MSDNKTLRAGRYADKTKHPILEEDVHWLRLSLVLLFIVMCFNEIFVLFYLVLTQGSATFIVKRAIFVLSSAK